MGFSPEAIESYQLRKELERRDAHWINESGWHTVEIESYRSKTGPARVVFTVRDDAGREQHVRIPVCTAGLRSNRLSSFLGAALHWEPYKCDEPSFGRARAPFYREVVGKRLKVFVTDSNRGRSVVMDWKALSEPA